MPVAARGIPVGIAVGGRGLPWALPRKFPVMYIALVDFKPSGFSKLKGGEAAMTRMYIHIA